MKNILTLLYLGLFLTSCQQDKEVNGYYISDNETYTEPKFDINRIYYRIHSDTVVAFKLIDFKVDSTAYIWSEEDTNFVMLDKQKPDPYTLGNRRYKVIDDNKITFVVDTTNFSPKRKAKFALLNAEILEEEFLRGLILKKDTLKRVNKSFIENAVREDFKKDSLLYYHPYTDEEFVIRQAVEYASFYIDGDLNPNSIKVNRISDDKFHVKFTTKMYGVSDNHFYLFDFDIGRYKATPL